MTYHSIVECVTNRPFEQVADDNHQATVNRVHGLFHIVYKDTSLLADKPTSILVGLSASRPTPAPLPTRVAMALAPPSKFLSTFLKHNYDVGII